MLSLKKVNHFLLTCGNADNLQDFVKAALDGVGDLCSYDHAIAYLFNENGKIVDRYLVNFSSRQSDIYLKYYFSQSFAIRYLNKPFVAATYDWGNVEPDEFSTNYIKAQGIKHSAYLHLTDPNGILRTLFALDRTRDTAFSDAEVETLRFVVPHLNNLHKKFFLPPKDITDRKQALMAVAGLTARETEIALLLCDGVSPTNINNVLHIAPGTTHKHITHIYKKLRVSNLQELLVYLLNSETHPAIQVEDKS